MNLSLAEIQIIVSLIVSTIGVGLAIKTYLQAKKSLLQPMKSAVVNKQTDLLIEVVSRFGADFSGIEMKMYYEIIRLTSLHFLYNNKLIDIDYDNLKEEIKGKMALNDIDKTYSLYIAKSSDTDEDIEHFFSKGDQGKNIRQGNFTVDILCYGPTTSMVFGKLSDYSSHPLIPSRIQQHIKRIEDNCLDILRTNLKNEIENFINHEFNKVRTNKIIYFDGIYNDFLRNGGGEKVHLNQLYSIKINSEIRNYLHVDDEWN